MITPAEGSLAEGVGGQRLSVLYEQHVARAVALARLLTGDDSLAEDLAHEAFIRAAGRFSHLRKPEVFHIYLRKAVFNQCRARFRRLHLEREWLKRQGGREMAEPAIDAGERDEMWRAITKLPWRQRAAVVLRYYEDLSVGEVGQILGCSTRAAEGLIARGLADLRGDLQTTPEGDE